MRALEKWFLNEDVFRLTPDGSLVGGLGCGFLAKSGRVNDVLDETYDRLAMVYLLRGRGHYRDSFGISCELAAGDVFFRCPNRSHSTILDPQSQWQEAYVTVREHWYPLLIEMGMFDPELVRLRIGALPEILQQIKRLMHRLRVVQTREESSRIELALVDVILKVLEFGKDSQRKESSHAAVLKQARERLLLHLTAPVDLESLLGDFGLSYSRLRVLFREAYGCTPGEFRIRRRMDEACVLLKDRTLTVSGVAERVGYADVFTFSKQFRKRVGVPPSKFRI